ncbi:WYL domain-containing protein [Streptomyces sp. R1]|uniref:WYL domain-containing protein n=1 Tax=Streptomyces TaxID=1883 RepID=UPI000AAA3F42|nr:MULTISPECIES: WYL domain-containing protein [unclassified Streptomyces]MCC8335972.1 WYL domain-containing protein [Streptomyces sp. R1]MDA4891143.1 WYL domain-containing protein [Streptomyces sp. MS2A]
MSRPVSRVLTLLELLQAGGVRTVAELADRLGVGERTVRRYVDHLVDLDVPVESVRGRYGGYRLAPGHRMPPLMLTDDEALAVLLGLVAGRRTGITAAAGTAGETAAAKVRRVLPDRLRRRLDAVLDSVTFTTAPAESAAPRAAVLLPIADAVRHHRPVSVRYTGGSGRGGERTLYPYGLVAHGGRWYVTGRDLSVAADRTFRLDRIAGARVLPGTFEPPPGPDPAERVLTALATAPYRHEVTVRVRGTAEEVRGLLPASVATVTAETGGGEAPPGSGGGGSPGSRGNDSPGCGGGDSPGSRYGGSPEPGAEASPEPGDDGSPESGGGGFPASWDADCPEPKPDTGAAPRAGTETAPGSGGGAEPWCQVEIRAERLDWLPGLLASLDRPFVVERPDELRALVADLADRLRDAARHRPAGEGPPRSRQA